MITHKGPFNSLAELSAWENQMKILRKAKLTGRYEDIQKAAQHFSMEDFND